MMHRYRLEFPKDETGGNFVWLCDGVHILNHKAAVLEVGFDNVQVFVLENNTWNQLDQHAVQAIFGGE